MIKHKYDFIEVKKRARRQWKSILRHILGLTDLQLSNKHQPCPSCGGVDRYRFDDRYGNGDFFCSQCGAGDGFGLIAKVKNCTFMEALRLVGDYVG